MKEKVRPLDPDSDFSEGDIEIKTDYFQLGQAFNRVLRKAGRRERMRWLVFEDDIFGRGIWTPEQASEIAETSRIVDGLPDAPESKVLNKGCLGWEKLSFNVDRKVIDVLVGGGLFDSIEGEGERYRVKLPDIYEGGRDLIIVEVAETDEGEVVNFKLSIIKPGRLPTVPEEEQLEGSVGVWAVETEEGTAMAYRINGQEKCARVYLPLDPNDLETLKEMLEQIYKLEISEVLDQKRVPAQALSQYYSLGLKLEIIAQMLPPIDFSPAPDS